MPRDPRRARYYYASLVAAGVLVVLAIALPFWIDYVRRSGDRASFDALHALPPPMTSAAQTPLGSDRTPGANLPYSPESGHATCQAYATARCNALGIPPGPCGEVITAALAVPPTAGLAECRKAVEPKLAEAATYRIASESLAEAPSQETEAEAPPQETEAEAPTGEPSRAVAAGDATAREEPSGPAASAPAQPRLTMSQAERADNLARIYVLVEELQRAAQNYATLPAAQAARFAELKRRVEADGSEDLRSLYNTLLLQQGRTAGVEMPPPGLHAREAPMTPAAPGEDRARTTTPEMDRVRELLEDARRQAGQASEPTPPVAPAAPPTSVDPSTVPAPPAQSI